MARNCCICGQKIGMLDGTKMFGGVICLSCNSKIGDLESPSVDTATDAIDYFDNFLNGGSMASEISEKVSNRIIAAKERVNCPVIPVKERDVIEVNCGIVKLVMTDVAFVFSQGREERTISFSQVISVEIKEPRKAYSTGRISIALGGAPNSFINLTGWLSVGNSNNVEVPFSSDQIEEAREMNRRYNLYLQEKNSASVQVPQISVADEIKKYKELLDIGAITQEEFEAKKKQLLGI